MKNEWQREGFMNSFYSEQELKQIGFKRCGENVKISRKTSIYAPGKIEIGNNVRIDDFALLTGNIIIGDYVHIATYAALFAGEKKIELKDYVGVSSRTTIYSQTDEYSGEYMTNPTVEDKYKNVIKREVILEKHALLGASCVVLPGSSIGEGTSVGAMTLVNRPLEAWSIYVGIPCKKIGDRSKKILELERKMNVNL